MPAFIEKREYPDTVPFNTSAQVIEQEQKGIVRIHGCLTQEEYINAVTTEHKGTTITRALIARNCEDPTFTNVWTDGEDEMHNNLFILAPVVDPHQGVQFKIVRDSRDQYLYNN